MKAQSGKTGVGTGGSRSKSVGASKSKRYRQTTQGPRKVAKGKAKSAVSQGGKYGMRSWGSGGGFAAPKKATTKKRGR